MADSCDCIINIANWPAARIDQWRALLKARAIENQIYVIGVNRIGTDGNGIEYSESSYAYAPDGTLKNLVVSEKGIGVVDIDAELVNSVQNSFPVRKDRRDSLYKDLIGF